MKTCSKCGIIKDHAEFSAGRPDCKKCRAAVAKQYFYANREAITEGRRAWRKANPRESRALSWAYYAQPKNRARRLVRLARERATKQGVPFELDVPFIERKLLTGHCEVTGLPFEFGMDHERTSHPFAPSIDRIIPERGYTKWNVQVVVFIHNLARGQWGDAALLKYAEALQNVWSDIEAAIESRVP